MSVEARVHLGLKFDVPAIQSLVERAAEQLELKLGPPRSGGRNRVVFFSKHAVLKLPRNDAGMFDNSREARMYRAAHHPYPLAACRLLHLHDIPVLMMTKLQLDAPVKDLPSWADYVDCGQVGRTLKGGFLAYDYA